MATGSSQFDRDFRKWQAQLMRAVHPATFHQKVQEKHLPGIVNAIIGTAKAGIGPGNKPYPAYSESYKKQLGLAVRGGAMTARKARSRALRSGEGWQAAKRAGRKLWLVGVIGMDRMLDPGKFSWELQGPRLFLCHEGGVVPATHQGDRYGGKSHTKGDIPDRPFLHFANSANAGSAQTSYRLTLERRTAKFNAGNLK